MSFNIQSNKLLTSSKQWFLFISILFFIFSINLTYEYQQYKQFTSLEIQNNTYKVLNIYNKKDYYILKLKNKNHTLYTSISNNNKDIKTQDIVDVDIITKNIKFFDYLKGFYAKLVNINKINQSNNSLYAISSYIDQQHNNKQISELFNALFLAIPISPSLRDHCIDFGISHLIALSGFHLGVLSFIIFWLIYFPYNYIHSRYIPYRNIKFDILIITAIILLIYLVFLDLVPSLLRAFVMYLFGIILYRNNIKIFSFHTLAIVLLIIISFFPKLIFSISLWLSILGVFYIFLFIQYFSSLNKIIQFLLFNIWIYLALNPIVHQIFPSGSYNQVYSVLITIGFSIFYPIELFLHIINYGNILDPIIELWLNIPNETFKTSTSIYFTLFYLLLSLFSIKYKEAFYLLNMAFMGFFIYIFIYFGNFFNLSLI
jgi:competence protein ComEC